MNKPIEQKEVVINVLTEMIDDLRSTLEPFEVLDSLKELQTLITKKPELVQEILADEICRAEKTCVDDNICPECGKELEPDDVEYNSEGDGFGCFYATASCTNCSFTTR